MIKDNPTYSRNFRNQQIKSDLVIVGGGLSGVCCAITAARQGIKVVLVQDRPVLGGNASSEVRLWVLGATSHMGNNNRWAREGGVIDELLVENMYRNPEGNPLIFDTILLEKVIEEKNITLLLNTAVYEIGKVNADIIESVTAFCPQNQTTYTLVAPLFCDASGDGVVGFLSGAAFRMGAEKQEEFGEKFAPSEEYGELLGHSLYFYSKDVGKPVKFVAPSYAIDVSEQIPRFRSFNTQEYGCRLWWLEYGGRLDTVHDTELIKWELWRVAYGVWDYIKNSGNFPESENLTLEWVGTIPGKRESRRFEGDYMLIQQDIVEQRTHFDAVAFGGWSIDLHPADGVFSDKPGCNQWHSKGIYDIPYRTMYSRNIKNLFLTGRIISASHVAFGSSRVMATSAYCGQAVGVAAALAHREGVLPKQLLEKNLLEQLQTQLIQTGQFLPNIVLKDKADLVQNALIRASSELKIHEFEENKDLLQPLSISVAQMIPLSGGRIPNLIVHAYGETETTLEVELRISDKATNQTPNVIIAKKSIAIRKGRNCLNLDWEGLSINTPQYVYVCLMKNEQISISRTEKRVTGILSVFNTVNKAVSNYGKQEPTEDIGVDTFEFWTPKRRPEGHNLSFKIDSPIALFSAENIKNGIARPTIRPNAWVADFKDKTPILTLNWTNKQSISRIEISFDTDFDHPMESVLMTHPENVMPFCVRNYRILDDKNQIIFEKKGNYQTRNIINLEKTISTKLITIELEHPSINTPASVFEVRCY
ncbi:MULTISPECIES: FAD-dependent oxidoreductase [Emticicia]|uniref:FAD-dependent oxidoreductase n=1 Tax=Emticicia TaxID=312278 RepID=UPI0007D89F51|nr:MULTISPECIES: FAD-dependent oxidoreductase [Emticicia]